MTDSLRSSLKRRRYRLAQAVTVGGSIALGTLVVNRLVEAFRENFFLYYGVSDTEYAQLHDNPVAQLPLTMGQLIIAAIALCVVTWFVWSERRRIRQATELDVASQRRNTEILVERLSHNSLFEQFVVRTSNVAALLLAIWLLQSSFERYLGGLGLGMQYADWRSLLPLASVFGVCVLAAMIVAGASLVGLRAISVLEFALAKLGLRAKRRREVRVCAGYATLDTARTFRELLGCDILSRPPPVTC